MNTGARTYVMALLGTLAVPGLADEANHADWSFKGARDAGAAYELSDYAQAFADYDKGSPAPARDALFSRLGPDTPGVALTSTRAALGQKPAKASQFQLGVRGEAGALSYGVMLYDLRLRDDVLIARHPSIKGLRMESAGSSRHRGVALQAGAPLAPTVRLDARLGYAGHDYGDWMRSTGTPGSGPGPHVTANAVLAWAPARATRAVIEWERLAAYWQDESRVTRHAIRQLVHVHAQWPVSPRISAFASLYNLMDRRLPAGEDAAPFSPALPRTVSAGVTLAW